MRRSFLSLILICSLPPCASLAEEPNTVAAEGQAPPPQAAKPPGTPEASGDGAEDADDAEDATGPSATAEEHAAVESEVEKYFRRLGYVPVKKDGGTYYCRDEAALGTRLKKQVCITEEIARRRRDDARREMEEKFGDRMWKEGMLAPQMPPVR